MIQTWHIRSSDLDIKKRLRMFKCELHSTYIFPAHSILCKFDLCKDIELALKTLKVNESLSTTTLQVEYLFVSLMTRVLASCDERLSPDEVRRLERAEERGPKLALETTVSRVKWRPLLVKNRCLPIPHY